jgi:hypothetical protein
MSKWLKHVKATMKTMKNEKKAMGKKWFSHVLKTAKKSYHKTGGDDLPKPEEKKEEGAEMTEGGRRKRSARGRKTARRRK